MYKSKKNLGSKVFDIALYVLMVALIITFIYPLWQTFVVSFSSPELAKSLGVKLWFDEFTLSSYKEILKDNLLFIGYKNTIIRVVLSTVLTVLASYFGAYSLTKKTLPFRKAILFFITFTMFFNGGLVPTFLTIKDLGLINSLWALVLPNIAVAWNVIIAKNFINTLPDSLEESAIIDGAHTLTVLFKILMPLSMPIIAVLILWTAVGSWNAWYDAMLFTPRREQTVLQNVLRRIVIDSRDDQKGVSSLLSMEKGASPESVKAAVIIFASAPIILFYPFLQKYFVKGVLIGSVKG